MKKKLSNRLRRYKRYLRYGLQYYLYEKPRGLDFTMRDMHLIKESGGVLHGYSKTNEKHLKEIFNTLHIKKEDRLLDVGCGKGVVLREAARYPFEKITGIDIDTNLVKTARKNFEILKLSGRVDCMAVNAIDYRKYGDYNTFFFFNPFSQEIFQAVINEIIAENEGRRQIRIIYHNPVYQEVVEATGRFKKIKEMYDDTKDYTTNIYISQWEA